MIAYWIGGVLIVGLLAWILMRRGIAGIYKITEVRDESAQPNKDSLPSELPKLEIELLENNVVKITEVGRQYRDERGVMLNGSTDIELTVRSGAGPIFSMFKSRKKLKIRENGMLELWVIGPGSNLIRAILIRE